MKFPRFGVGYAVYVLVAGSVALLSGCSGSKSNSAAADNASGAPVTTLPQGTGTGAAFGLGSKAAAQPGSSKVARGHATKAPLKSKHRHNISTSKKGAVRAHDSSGAIASFSGLTTAFVNEVLEFDDTSSAYGTAPDGGDNFIVSSDWSDSLGGSGSGVIYDFSSSNSGTFTVYLTVTDANGFSDTASASIDVSVQPSVFSRFNASATAAFTGQDIDFSDDSIAYGDINRISDVSWDFGDGSGTYSGSDISHYYSASGTYTVTETVTDIYNDTDSSSVDVKITVPDSVYASFTYGPNPAYEDERVDFNDGSYLSSANASITDEIWNFGDGSPLYHGSSTSHRFSLAGTYYVTLTVFDDQGHSDTQGGYITILAVTPDEIFTSFSYQNTGSGPIQVGTSVNFWDTSTFTGSDIVAKDWDFGDGSLDSGSNVYHTYSYSGNYQVILTLTDADGVRSSNSAWIKVKSIPNLPVIQPLTPYNAASGSLDLSPGMLATVQAPGLAAVGTSASAALGTKAYPSWFWPTYLDGVQVTVNGTEAGLLYVGDSAQYGGQVNFQIPPGTPVGLADIRVYSNGQLVGEAPNAVIGQNAAGMFDAYYSNTKAYNLLNGVVIYLKNGVISSTYDYTASQSVPGQANTIPLQSRGQAILEIYATGVHTAGSVPYVLINGKQVKTLYSGPQGTNPGPGVFQGLDQINVNLPANLPAGQVSVQIPGSKQVLFMQVGN